MPVAAILRPLQFNFSLFPEVTPGRGGVNMLRRRCASTPVHRRQEVACVDDVVSRQISRPLLHFWPCTTVNQSNDYTYAFCIAVYIVSRDMSATTTVRAGVGKPAVRVLKQVAL